MPAPDRAVAGGSDKGSLQLGMHRNFPGFRPLVVPNPQGGPVAVQPKVAGFQRQCLGYPESGPPLQEDQKPCLGLGAAASNASTSGLSRYSGSVKPLALGDCCSAASLVFTPRGRRLRETVVQRLLE